MKEERLKKKSQKVIQMCYRGLAKVENLRRRKHCSSRRFEEQDNITQAEDEDEPPARQRTSRDLAGFKVLDGLDKVIEGGAVVLTLKDQNILADGDINQDFLR